MTTPAFQKLARLDQHAFRMRGRAAQAVREAALGGTLGRKALEAAAAAFDVSVQSIIGPRRDLVLVAARRYVCIELRQAGWPLLRIARLIGRNDHTSVLYYLRTGKRVPSPSFDVAAPDESGVWAI